MFVSRPARARHKWCTPTGPPRLRCYPGMRVLGEIRRTRGHYGREEKGSRSGSVNDAKATDKAAKKKAAPPQAAAEPAPPMKSTKIPKLAKKNKSRLPRR